MLTPIEDQVIINNKVDMKVDLDIKHLVVKEVEEVVVILVVILQEVEKIIEVPEVVNLVVVEILEIQEVVKKDTLLPEILIHPEEEMKEMIIEVVLPEVEKNIDLVNVVVIQEMLENMLVHLEEKEVDHQKEEEEIVDHLHQEVVKLKKNLHPNGKFKNEEVIKAEELEFKLSMSGKEENSFNSCC